LGEKARHSLIFDSNQAHVIYYSHMGSQKDLKELGNKLKEAREKANLTQAEVASKAGMNTNYYARIERGEINTSYEKLHRIAEVLKLKII
jgi:DNA-binding XRE family transcriptional regulator